MRDIPVWLLVLVGMVGVLALSLLVYVLLPHKSGVGGPAESGAPAAPDEDAEHQGVATPRPPALSPDTPAGPATGGAAPAPGHESGPRHAVTPSARGVEMPTQAVEWPAAAAEQPAPVVPEQGQGRHALPAQPDQPAGLVHDHIANGAAPPDGTVPIPMEADAASPTNAAAASPGQPSALEPTYARAAPYVGPLVPAESSEQTEVLRNGAGPTPWAPPEPDDAAVWSAAHETAAGNGATTERWEPPAVPTEMPPPSQETAALWAPQADLTEPSPPSDDAAPASNTLFEPVRPPDPLHSGFGPSATAPQVGTRPDPPGQAPQHPVAEFVDVPSAGGSPAAPSNDPPADAPQATTPPAETSVASAPTPPSACPDPTPPPSPAAPSGMGTDPAMSAIGGSEPLVLADAVAQPQASAADAGPPEPDSTYPNSAPPGPNGSPPSEEYTIKGNEGSHRFHTPDSPFYIRTRADVWFCTADDAERAGFRPWNQGRR